VDIVVEFQSRKSPGVECNRVQFAIQICNWKDSRVHSQRHHLDCNLSVWDPMGKDQSCGESLFKCYKGGVLQVPAPGEYGWVYASELLGGMWRTIGSDFESLVYVSGLYFRLNISILPRTIIYKLRGIFSVKSLQPETLPSILRHL